MSLGEFNFFGVTTSKTPVVFVRSILELSISLVLKENFYGIFVTLLVV